MRRTQRLCKPRTTGRRPLGITDCRMASNRRRLSGRQLRHGNDDRCLVRAREFIGGLILPGVELMQHSLIAATAQLHRITANMRVFRTTPPTPCSAARYKPAVARYSGNMRCLTIPVLSIVEGTPPPVVLSGGAAELLRSHLNLPLRMVDNLVLQGLLLIAQEAGTS